MMKNRIWVTFAPLALLVMLVVPAFAHHGNAAYDTKTVVVKGIVMEWKWTNPHTILKFDAKDENGNVVHWLGEWNNPSTLSNFGITVKSFKVGEEVTVTMRGMAKSGAPLGRIEKVVLADGQELSMGDER
jgi:heme/copper-type cytochrome/quinol oxidase subunit 2